MPLGPQPRRARGTVGHPYTALRLRLVLAVFGLVSCLVLAWLSWHQDVPALSVVLLVFAAVAVVDIVVIQLRRRANRRLGNGAPGPVDHLPPEDLPGPGDHLNVDDILGPGGHPDPHGPDRHDHADPSGRMDAPDRAGAPDQPDTPEQTDHSGRMDTGRRRGRRGRDRSPPPVVDDDPASRGRDRGRAARPGGRRAAVRHRPHRRR